MKKKKGPTLPPKTLNIFKVLMPQVHRYLNSFSPTHHICIQNVTKGLLYKHTFVTTKQSQIFQWHLYGSSLHNFFFFFFEKSLKVIIVKCRAWYYAWSPVIGRLHLNFTHPCGRFWNHLPQGACEFQLTRFPIQAPPRSCTCQFCMCRQSHENHHWVYTQRSFFTSETTKIKYCKRYHYEVNRSELHVNC